MSNNEITRPRNVGIGAAATPLLIVGAMVLFNGVSHPESSVAGVQAPPDPETIIHPPEIEYTDAQMSAVRFREQIPELTESESPFELTIAPSTDSTDDDDPDELDPRLTVQPRFIVTAMVASESGNIALINGKARREGDKLDGGWVIEEIDVRAKRVVLLDPQGKPITLGLNRPGS